MSTLLGLLALASSIAGAVGSEEDDKAKAEYEEKLAAWERQREQIAERNRILQERRARRATMASAVGSDIPILPPKLERVPGSSTAPDSPDPSSATELARTLGTISSLANATGGLTSSGSTLPILGAAMDTYSRPSSSSQNGVTAAWEASAPTVGGSYNYTDRYNPRRTYLSGE